jgi:Cell division protein FtsI/penicillin-binding protein 2
MYRLAISRLVALSLVVCLLGGTCSPLAAATAKKPVKKTATKTAKKRTTATVAKASAQKAKKASYSRSTKSSTAKAQRKVSYSPWVTPTYADSTYGDNVDGEDLVVRRAAVEALGPYNGTVVAVDPKTGRILTIVNQKLALRSSFQPCSTIKIVAGLAALSEGIINRNTMIKLGGKYSMNLTEALARSNNPYFAILGQKLGFEKVSYYARLFGLGEPAGLNIEGETAGVLPSAPPKNGGVGMMTSFGEGISLSPLQLAALMSAISNGGTLYYLQYPRNQEEVKSFVPRVKRHLDIQKWIPEIKPGMMGAVEYGTARRAAYDPNEPILGKTGTCTDPARAHMGWFGSFNDVDHNPIVVVVMLTGGKPVNGPVAAGIAGNVYRNLSEQRYFAESKANAFTPAALVSTQSCCSN